MIDFKQQVAEVLSNEIDALSTDEIRKLIEIPPKSEMGDYSFPVSGWRRRTRRRR